MPIVREELIELMDRAFAAQRLWLDERFRALDIKSEDLLAQQRTANGRTGTLEQAVSRHGVQLENLDEEMDRVRDRLHTHSNGLQAVVGWPVMMRAIIKEEFSSQSPAKPSSLTTFSGLTVTFGLVKEFWWLFAGVAGLTASAVIYASRHGLL